VVAIPLALLLLVVLHLVALRQVGSNNPDGVEIKAKRDATGKPLDGIPFHPFYTVKDLVGILGFLTVFALVVFEIPTFGDLFLEKANFTLANPLSTPDPIAPSWYFTPYYAILRSFPNKNIGALAMLIGVLAYFFLPWLDRSPVKSIRYRGWIFKAFLALFTVSFLALMYLGMQTPQGIYLPLSRVFTATYLAFFLLMPWYTKIDPVKPVPERVTYHGH
jgi:ubiquinol-cytochrome c reductase cytochrome b subunit